jgi:hypothetical protein
LAVNREPDGPSGPHPSSAAEEISGFLHINPHLSVPHHLQTAPTADPANARQILNTERYAFGKVKKWRKRRSTGLCAPTKGCARWGADRQMDVRLAHKGNDPSRQALEDRVISD